MVSMEDPLDTLISQVDQYAQRLKMILEERQSLRQALDEREKALNKMREEFSELQRSAESYKARVTDLERETEKKGVEARELREKLSELGREREALNNRIADIAAELKRRDASIGDLQREIQNLKERVKELDEVRERLRESEERGRELNSRVDDLEAELESKAEQVAGLNSTITSLMNENAKLRERREARSGDVHAQEVTKQLEKKEEEVRALSAKLGGLEKELEARDRRIEKLEEDVRKMPSENLELKSAARTTGSDEEHLKIRIVELERRLEEKNSLIERLEKDLKRASAENLDTRKAPERAGGADEMVHLKKSVVEPEVKGAQPDKPDVRTADALKERAELIKEAAPAATMPTAPEKPPVVPEQPTPLSTGFQRLDSMLGGGMAPGSRAFVVCNASPLRDLFLAELAINEIRRGYGVIYVSAERTGKAVEQRITSKVPKGTCAVFANIVDCVSMSENRFEPPIRYLTVPNDFSWIDGAIEDSFAYLSGTRTKKQVLIFDSLDGVIKSGSRDPADLVRGIKKVMEDRACFALFAVDPNIHSKILVSALLENASAVITLDQRSNRVKLSRDGNETERPYIATDISFAIP